MIIFPYAKLVCTGSCGDIRTNGVGSKIFLYRADVSDSLKIKSIYRYNPWSLPFCIHISGIVKIDSLTSKQFIMKKIENNFTVSGFLGKDAEIRQFTNASVARFSMAISRQERNGDDSRRVSAFINAEAWRKNGNTDAFEQLTKGTLLTVEGYFKPEEWSDKDGVKHSRVILMATAFYPTPEKEDAPEEKPEDKKKSK